MTEAVQIGNATLYCGDCLDVLRTLPDASIEAIVTDPPYGLSDHKADDVIACLTAWIGGKSYKPKGKGFMGKAWDAWVPGPEVWREALRVLKPGGHILAFAGTRSMDLMSMAIRLAGFELRDSIGWAHDAGGAPLLAYVYGSGFPKSLDVSKALNKLAGEERKVIGDSGTGRKSQTGRNGCETIRLWGNAEGASPITAPATDAARQWSGWGTALKPAWEPIILARKPLDGTVAQNVLAHGCGGLNVDGCRVPIDDSLNGGAYSENRKPSESEWVKSGGTIQRFAGKEFVQPQGRWPANLIHDGSEDVVGLFPETECFQYFGGDTGSAARFFYTAKASQADRDEGLDGFAERKSAIEGAPSKSKQCAECARRYAAIYQACHRCGSSSYTFEKHKNIGARGGFSRNHHPTVKPSALMRYLCRLVTPPGGIVLDPFMGSGSTGRGAALEGFRFIGIEREPDYLAIAQARIKAAQRQPDLFHAAVAA